MSIAKRNARCPTCKGLGVINPYFSRSLHSSAIFGTPCPAKCDPLVDRTAGERKAVKMVHLMVEQIKR